jgi:hypothetical protein
MGTGFHGGGGESRRKNTRRGWGTAGGGRSSQGQAEEPGRRRLGPLGDGKDGGAAPVQP